MAARHSWATEGGTKTCKSCGIEEVARFECGHWWQAIYKQGDRLAILSSRVPACGQPLPEVTSPERRREMATDLDRLAGLAFRSGDHQRAAQNVAACRVLDPDRSDLWAARAQRIRISAEAVQRREQQRLPLADVVKQRLADAGLSDSPELSYWRNWNRQVMQKEIEP